MGLGLGLGRRFGFGFGFGFGLGFGFGFGFGIVLGLGLGLRVSSRLSSMERVCMRTACFSESAPTKPQTNPFLKSARRIWSGLGCA